MTGLPDPFQHDDASYVLGLLTEQERTAFENHLSRCAACTERVRRLAGLPAALAGLTERDLEGPHVPQVPDTLLAGLLHQAAVSRHRRRWLLGTLTGVAAASLAALILVSSLVARGPSAAGDAV
ncbi:MAG: zf-HC2 domain-containing protein, partial [Actinomycetota bacterium]|nr:zf-HC2 domain-containing protein [Actinomycetota bacterium]